MQINLSKPEKIGLGGLGAAFLAGVAAFAIGVWGGHEIALLSGGAVIAGSLAGGVYIFAAKGCRTQMAYRSCKHSFEKLRLKD